MTTPKQRPKTWRRILKWYFWSMAGLVVVGGLLGALGFGKEDSEESVSVKTPDNAAVSSPDQDRDAESDQTPSLSMPNATGMVLSAAREVFDDKNLPYQDEIDLLESRSVWDADNWVVRDQLPEPGTLISEADRICLGIVKLDEDWRENLNPLSCWDEATEEEAAGLSLDFVSESEIKAIVYNQSSFPVHLRVNVGIEIDSPSFQGIELDLTYCSESKAQPGRSSVSMRIAPQDLMGQYDSEAFLLELNPRFKFSVLALEKNSGGRCDNDFPPFEIR